MRHLYNQEIKELQKKLAANQKRGVNTLRAAIYARKSAEDERQTSLPTQIDLCKKLIDSYDFMTLTHTFSEDNVSGMFTDGRKEYLKMMELAEKREIDIIVVMKFDRLSRDLADSTTAIKFLNKCGCHLIAGDDVSNPNSPDGEFVRNVMLAHSQMHPRRVASDVIATDLRNAEQGISAGGIAPYGLKIVNQRFEINEQEAHAIKKLFQMHIEGHSYKQIIDELTRLGYFARNGKRFTYSTIYEMLKNDKYYGTYVYNREGGKRRKNRVLIEHFDEVRNDKAIPPIITKEIFDAAQARTAERNTCRARQNENPSFVLTGLVYCASCGKSMSGETNRGGSAKTRRRTYCCPNHSTRNGRTCATKAINADYLEASVRDILTASINDYIQKADTKQISNTLFTELNEEARAISRYIADTESKANKFLERAVLASSPRIAETYEKQADEFLASVENYKTKLEEINARLQYIKSCFGKGAGLNAEKLFVSRDSFRELAQLFIKRIEIDDANDEINIFFND